MDLANDSLGINGPYVLTPSTFIIAFRSHLSSLGKGKRARDKRSPLEKRHAMGEITVKYHLGSDSLCRGIIYLFLQRVNIGKRGFIRIY